ncbi:MAG TPA: hypothetical protein DER09_05735 [Prolixibacteraceae bacterium]|nr:hypothetical protein [Prolixibacteraceae bacterium]
MIKQIKCPNVVIISILIVTLIISGKTLNAQTSSFVSNLPIVLIDTEGKNIPNEPKISARMKIIDNSTNQNKITDPANGYDGFIGIELRGASSQSYPQKPFAIETRDAQGNNLNVSLLGMPDENDWVMLSNYNDKSFMRNVLGYKMFDALGNYAPRTRYVEVFLNGEYQGIYLFGEKIKRDKNRVDIATLKEEDIEGEELTGGYIFKIDYWNDWDSWESPFSPINHPDFDIHFIYHDPDWDELLPQQKNYISNFVSDFETILYGSNYTHPTDGYSKWIDVESFIDYFIVNEISRNNDGFKKSRYFHKDKNGKITAGPVWDFDWAWKNINECYIFKATDGSGWSYKVNDCNPWVKSPGWMIRLFYDSDFRNNTKCQYNDARAGVLSDENLSFWIDSLYNEVKEAQVRHFGKWKILGLNVGAPEVDAQPKTYDGEVEKLRQWIATRLNWLDRNMIGTCTSTNIISELTNNSEIRIFPNPVSEKLNVVSEKQLLEIRIFNNTGNQVFRNNMFKSTTEQVDVSGFAPGLYILQLNTADGCTYSQKLIVQH